MAGRIFLPAREYLQSLLPANLIELPDVAALDDLWMEPINTVEDPSVVLTTAILLESELSLGIPGVDAVRLVIGPYGTGTEFMFRFDAEPTPRLSLVDLPIALRFSQDILKPVRPKAGSGATPAWEIDPDRPFVDITLAKVTVRLDLDGNFSIETDLTLDLPPAMIGDSGVVIEASNVGLFLDSTAPPPGKPAGWRGVHIGHAALHLPGDLSASVGTLELTDAYIGNGGFSGTVSDTWSPALSAELFGIQFTLAHADLTFVQNALTAGAISGQVTLPFFDEPLDVELGVGLGGSINVKLSSATGLITLTKPDILTLSVESLGFQVDSGVFTVLLSGDIKPLVGGLDWPTFKVKELSIDSKGNVHLDGGWLDLGQGYTLDFYAFQLEITKIGFGKSDDGGKWIGFSGGLKLVEGLSAGASVDGLRVTWYDDGRPVGITLEGVGVEFEVPDVVRFKGQVSYRELEVAGETVHRFDGSIKLELISIGLEIDAVLVVGSASGPAGTYTFFAIYLGVELPAGIPLWSTGLALYGLAGLFALNMEPDKHPDEGWYGIGPGDGWYHRGTVGVTDLEAKWVNKLGSLALGGGVTIGTVYDNGFTFSGRVLLVLVFPGPIIMIEGKANMLKERSSLSDEPLFRALAVLDFREGTITLGLDAQYKFADGGELIEIAGSAEAFFSFSDPEAWHLYIGVKDPREKRIRAEIFQLFESNAYFMLDAHQLAMGAWIGYDKHWSFGPLSVTIEAWIEGNAVISWKPVHLHGDLWLHGKAELGVFGFGLGLSVDARFAADVFDPFHVMASFEVGISLPWPLPDFDVTIKLEWGPEPVAPPMPLPLKEIAVEHFKVTTSWPLPRGGGQPLLLPNFDDGAGFRHDPVPAVAAQQAAGPVAGAPVVPLDGRPHITFGRSVHDDALVGLNPQPPQPEYERIGDPAKDEGPVKARFSLKEVALHRWDGAAWQLAARKGTAANPAGVPTLYGSWAPVPAPGGGGQAVAQSKLWLWSKTPFDYTRHATSSWDEWFTDQYDGYPCIDLPPERYVCCDFEDLPKGTILTPPYKCEDTGIVISWLEPPRLQVEVLPQPVEGKTHAICFPPDSREGRRGVANVITVAPPSPASQVRLLVSAHSEDERRECIDFGAQKRGRGPNPREQDGATFYVFDQDGQAAPATRIVAVQTPQGTLMGFATGARLEIKLPCPADAVVMSLTTRNDLKVVARDGNGHAVDGVGLGGNGAPQTVNLSGPGIVEVTVFSGDGEAVLHSICYVCGDRGAGEVWATGYDDDGDSYGPFFAQGNVIEVDGKDMTRVEARSKQGFCLVEVCARVGATQEQIAAIEEMTQHMRDELARWTQTGDVLQPHTSYRLTVATRIDAIPDEPLDWPGGVAPPFDQTEFAYFRTEGPPGLTTLSLPVGQTGEFDSGIGDLSRYVSQTVPATVPPPGALPLLPRPVYRGYDTGVEFNEDYVDLMYRLEGRDLGLYLYDTNNLPVRDAEGRLIVLANQWGKADVLTLTESASLWITAVNQGDCGSLDATMIPHNSAIASAGQVLDPDTVYDARLIPLLLHEAFLNIAPATVAAGSGARLGAWLVQDAAGANEGPSHWEVKEEGLPAVRYVIQTSNLWAGPDVDPDPTKPGTLLLYDGTGAAAWTDYRLSLFLRAGDDDAIGAVFRYVDANNFYRFSMDRERRYRRLVRVISGITTVLAEDDFVFTQASDYQITVEAVGASLKVYQDGDLIFDFSDGSLSNGRIGLYCWAHQGARFSDVRVDDFRPEAPVVYHYQFTSSSFVDFFHHQHSFQDETWAAPVGGGTNLAPEITQAVPGSGILSAPGDAEARAFETLATKVMGAAAAKAPAEVQVSRIEQGGQPIGLLVRGPEPVDWRRTRAELSEADDLSAAPQAPDELKLTGVTFATTEPNQESVSLLLREALDLKGTRVEHLGFAGPVRPDAGDPVLFEDDFSGDAAGFLFRETFAPNALDHYQIIDEADQYGPSHWTLSGGHVLQDSNIYGGSVTDSKPDKPGTLALTGSPSWANVRVRGRLRSTDNDGIGIVLRFNGAGDHYRFAMDQQRNFRHFTKRVGGVTTVLWSEDKSYNLGQAYIIEVIAFGDRLIGYLDGRLLFNLRDNSVDAGRVGLYAWLNTGAHFEALEVESVETAPILLDPPLAALSEVEIVDPASPVAGPSMWAMAGGVLSQTSAARTAPDATVRQAGTLALLGDVSRRDYHVSATLRSDTSDAIGIVFRYESATRYYRFSMDAAAGYRRLVRFSGGSVTVLWQDALAYTTSQSYEVTIAAAGNQLQGWIDGKAVFSIFDGEVKRGRIGFYCRNNTGANFSHALVLDSTRRIGAWAVEDRDRATGASAWKRSGGAIAQTATIAGGAAPDLPGTIAIAGDPAWRDYGVSVRVRSDTDKAIGLAFRWVDEDNYYRFSTDHSASYRRLVKRVDGVTTVLWQDSGSFPTGVEMTVTVEAAGPRLKGFVNGAPLFSVSDAAIPAGRIGLHAWANTGARFRQVTVTRLPAESYALLADGFAKNDLGGWTFVDEGTVAGPSAWAIASGVLRQSSNIYSNPTTRPPLPKPGTSALAGDAAWTDVILTTRLASFDDDALGVYIRYQDANNYYRFSMDRERQCRRLVKKVGGAFTLLWEDSEQYETGRWYDLAVVAQGSRLRAYLDGVPVFVVDDADLPTGKVGLYCWANMDARFSEVHVYPTDLLPGAWLLRDSFPVLAKDRWTFIDDGDTDGPSIWKVAGGELSQESLIHGGPPAPAQLAKPGTAAVAGDAAWGDYQASVVLRTETDQAIGVVFRYQDQNNFYRFSCDASRSYRRLVKCVASVFTSLWQDNTVATVGHDYVFTVRALGSRLTGYLDGVRLFSVQDSALAAGRVGLYAWSNKGAKFAEVRVAAPVWQSFYRFGTERRRAAGTRVRIFSGNEGDPHAAGPEGQLRFAAGPGQRGSQRLDPGGARLRIVRPRVQGGHSRTLLPEAAYAASAGFRLLRKADGTAFFVFLPSGPAPGSRLTAGQYRLKLTYNRDNRAVDPPSQVLREAGSIAAEEAALDIPWAEVI